MKDVPNPDPEFLKALDRFVKKPTRAKMTVVDSYIRVGGLRKTLGCYGEWVCFNCECYLGENSLCLILRDAFANQTLSNCHMAALEFLTLVKSGKEKRK